MQANSNKMEIKITKAWDKERDDISVSLIKLITCHLPFLRYALK